MKKTLLLPIIFMATMHTKAQELAGTTIGFSFGPSFLTSKPSDYSLDPGSNNLITQKLSNKNLVVSSVLTIKFAKLSQEIKNENGSNKKRLVMTDVSDEKDNTQQKNAPFINRLAFNLAINLADISSDNLAFNKSVDGGIGFGYILTPTMQFAVFYDMIRIRQMRDHIIKTYEGKPIPKGTEFYNALDISDNNLYYNKTFSGISFKIVVALNPKKD